jgi:hypothetical protein
MNEYTYEIDFKTGVPGNRTTDTVRAINNNTADTMMRARYGSVARRIACVKVTSLKNSNRSIFDNSNNSQESTTSQEQASALQIGILVLGVIFFIIYSAL